MNLIETKPYEGKVIDVESFKTYDDNEWRVEVRKTASRRYAIVTLYNEKLLAKPIIVFSREKAFSYMRWLFSNNETKTNETNNEQEK